jgi:uncharacterized protein
MRITFDPEKRERTWIERGLAFEEAAAVFAGRHVTIPDDRKDYGEPRFLTFGMLEGRAVTLVWTPRADARRVISMRYANERERERFARYLGRSG